MSSSAASYRLRAIDAEGGQAIVQGRERWFLISIDNDWEPVVLESRRDAIRLSARAPFRLLRREDDSPGRVFSQMSDAVESVRAEWKGHFASKEVPELADVIHLLPADLRAVADDPPPQDPELRYTERLLIGARKGTPGAREKFFEYVMPYVARFVKHRWGGDLQARAGADDVVQEIFVALLQRKHPDDLETPGSARAWLRGVILNVIRDQWRRSRAKKRDVAREAPLDALAHEPGSAQRSAPAEMFEEYEERADLLSALALLDPMERRIVESYYFDERTDKEIAQELEKSESYVGRLRRKSMDRLATLMHGN
ncbi:MAG: sigma-70 family RNA polymerase sigma factor [Planctomycetota bacterium]